MEFKPDFEKMRRDVHTDFNKHWRENVSEDVSMAMDNFHAITESEIICQKFIEKYHEQLMEYLTTKE